MTNQTEDFELKEQFSKLAQVLKENENQINNELIDIQGSSTDLGGYYFPSEEKATAAMRPSAILNNAIDNF